MRPRLLFATAATALTCASAPAFAATSALTIDAAGTLGSTVTGSASASQKGSTTSMAVASASGGTITVAAGPSTALPRSWRFPAYVATGTYPRAVLRLAGDSSALNPGSAALTWGAVFEIDATSSSRTIDNGDNVFQRGLANSSAQFKLEVDHHKAACTVKGSAGKVVVRSSRTLQAGTWYQATCTRSGGTVTVSVRTYGGSDVTSASASGSIGTLVYGSTTYASVGGKLSPGGALHTSATDQFNGRIAQVSVSVG